MTITSEQVLAELKRIKGPDLEGNIVDLGLVSGVSIRDGKVAFAITVPAARAADLDGLREAAQTVVEKMPGVVSVAAVLTADAAGRSTPGAGARVAASGAHTHSHAPASRAPAKPKVARMTGVKHLLAVASGKGGVGKSTTAVNLALGLQAIGLRAGILDADIYGPSQPRLLGLTGRPEMTPEGKLAPMMAYGIACMSMGFMIDEETPIVWRGPMVVQALQQMLHDVAWAQHGDLDVLVIDMPPGTGDVQLTMAQQTPLSGAVIVSTPQDLALIDARKGLNMFRKVEVPVLGIVENMSYFVCPKCGEQADIFGHGGAAREAERLKLPLLGSIPLDMEVRIRSDTGQPITVTLPDSVHAGLYRDLAAKTWAELQAAAGHAVPPPQLTIAPANDALAVTFDDGASYTLPAEMLRVMSPSAEVQGHSADQRVTVGGKRKVKIVSLDPIGNYAVKITFDDRHNTGLFTWDYLRQLGREQSQRWAGYLSELQKKGLSRD